MMIGRQLVLSRLAAVVVLACAAVLQAVGTAEAAVPGEIDGHRWGYNDSWHGWPVAPVHRQHPIRGSFLDPRGQNYHFGIDINVNDKQPEAGHPRGGSHRVYAVESGYVTRVFNAPCPDGRIAVGHFQYWHTIGTVRPGQYVHAGQMIGWTCLASWHVHLSEWTRINGTLVWVNPLHPGGKLAPYTDTLRPMIHAIRFYAPAARLRPYGLHGLVDVRAWIGDPQSFRGFFTGDYARLYADLHPYGVTVRILRNGRVLLKHRVFRADALLSTRLWSIGTPVPFWRHYAPGTRANWNANLCLARQPPSCVGAYWFHLFGSATSLFWNTRAYANGSYVVRVTAWDVRRNASSRNVAVTIRN